MCCTSQDIVVSVGLDETFDEVRTSRSRVMAAMVWVNELQKPEVRLPLDLLRETSSFVDKDNGCPPFPHSSPRPSDPSMFQPPRSVLVVDVIIATGILSALFLAGLQPWVQNRMAITGPPYVERLAGEGVCVDGIGQGFSFYKATVEFNLACLALGRAMHEFGCRGVSVFPKSPQGDSLECRVHMRHGDAGRSPTPEMMAKWKRWTSSPMLFHGEGGLITGEPVSAFSMFEDDVYAGCAPVELTPLRRTEDVTKERCASLCLQYTNCTGFTLSPGKQYCTLFLEECLLPREKKRMFRRVRYGEEETRWSLQLGVVSWGSRTTSTLQCSERVPQGTSQHLLLPELAGSATGCYHLAMESLSGFNSTSWSPDGRCLAENVDYPHPAPTITFCPGLKNGSVHGSLDKAVAAASNYPHWQRVVLRELQSNGSAPLPSSWTQCYEKETKFHGVQCYSLSQSPMTQVGGLSWESCGSFHTEGAQASLRIRLARTSGLVTSFRVADVAFELCDTPAHFLTVTRDEYGSCTSKIMSKPLHEARSAAGFSMMTNQYQGGRTAVFESLACPGWFLSLADNSIVLAEGETMSSRFAYHRLMGLCEQCTPYHGDRPNPEPPAVPIFETKYLMADKGCPPPTRKITSLAECTEAAQYIGVADPKSLPSTDSGPVGCFQSEGVLFFKKTAQSGEVDHLYRHACAIEPYATWNTAKRALSFSNKGWIIALYLCMLVLMLVTTWELHIVLCMFLNPSQQKARNAMGMRMCLCASIGLGISIAIVSLQSFIVVSETWLAFLENILGDDKYCQGRRELNDCRVVPQTGWIACFVIGGLGSLHFGPHLLAGHHSPQWQSQYGGACVQARLNESAVFAMLSICTLLPLSIVMVAIVFL